MYIPAFNFSDSRNHSDLIEQVQASSGQWLHTSHQKWLKISYDGFG